MGIEMINEEIVAEYMSYWNFWVRVFKAGEAYAIYAGQRSHERFAGSFTDPDLIAALTDYDVSNFKDPSANIWRLYTCCDVLAKCMTPDADQQIWFRDFMLYVFLKLTPDDVKKIDWVIPGFDELYKWSEEVDFIKTLDSLSEDSAEYRNRMVQDKGEKHSDLDRWLYSGLTNSQFEKILQGYGELPDVSLLDEGIDLGSGGRTLLPCVWDMRALRKLYPDTVTADWYVVGFMDSCMFYGKDFLRFLLSSGVEIKKTERNVKVVNVEIVTDPSAEMYFDWICNTFGVAVDYNDMPKTEAKRFECDNSCAIIWLPVCLTDYFKEVVEGGWCKSAGSLKGYADVRDRILHFVSPNNRVYLAAEKNIAVTGFYRDGDQVYCETSYGLVRLPDDIDEEPQCWWVGEFSEPFCQGITSTERIPIEKTLEEMVYLNDANKLPA